MTLQSVLQNMEGLSVGILFFFPCLFLLLHLVYLARGSRRPTCQDATSGQIQKVKGLTFEHSASRVDVHTHVTWSRHTHAGISACYV